HFGKAAKEKTVSELESEMESVRRLAKKAEFEYYKRRITEEQFKKLSMEYQQRADSIDAAIKSVANKKIIGEMRKKKEAAEPSHVESVKMGVLGKNRGSEKGDFARPKRASKSVSFEEIRIPEQEFDFGKKEKESGKPLEAEAKPEAKTEAKKTENAGLSKDELALVYRLVLRLSGEKSRHSKEEMLKTLVGEGISRKVAEKTIEAIYSE
ncbi:MAG: hypothetical protein WC602_06425, partial [archaeon]